MPKFEDYIKEKNDMYDKKGKQKRPFSDDEIAKMTKMTIPGVIKVWKRALDKMFIDVKKQNKNMDDYGAMIAIHQALAKEGTLIPIHKFYKMLPKNRQEAVKVNAAEIYGIKI